MSAILGAALAAALASVPTVPPTTVPMTVTVSIERSPGAVAACGKLLMGPAAPPVAPRSSLHTMLRLTVGETWSTWITGPGGLGLELMPTLPEPGILRLATRTLNGAKTIAASTLVMRLGEAATVIAGGDGACSTLTIVAKAEPPLKSPVNTFVFQPTPGHDPERLAAAVERQLRGNGDSEHLSATVNPVTGAVLVYGEPALLGEARQLIEALDRKE